MSVSEPLEAKPTHLGGLRCSDYKIKKREKAELSFQAVIGRSQQGDTPQQAGHIIWLYGCSHPW